MSKVYFIKAREGEDVRTLKRKLSKVLKAAGAFGFIEKNELVAVKVSFGDKGNTGFVSPDCLKIIADKIKNCGARPFLTDTNTLYHGQRTNAVDHLNLAREHGFDKVGIPIIIGDGLRGEQTRNIKIDKPHFKEVKVAGIALECDGIAAVSHFTGHMMTGFGGAIKNIGMGFASRAGKQMQHSGVNPNVIGRKCTLCRACMNVCPVSAIVVRNKKAYIRDKICVGCADCLVACKFDAIEISWEETEKALQEKMAEFAYGVFKLKEKRITFITFAWGITKECDCLAKDDPNIVDDLGIFVSNDPVAIDKAAVDMVLKENNEDSFKKEHPKVDWHHQLDYAQRIGLGKLAYELCALTP